MTRTEQVEALIERLSCYGYGIRRNDPCADKDDDEIERIISGWLDEIAEGE